MIWPLARRRAAIRPLLVADSDDCASLHKTSFAHAWSATEFEDLISSHAVGGSAAVVRGGGTIGFVLSRSAAKEAEILTLVVRPDRRRQGLGVDLMMERLGRLAAEGNDAVFLEVDESNAAARALYARLGFVPVGARTAYYRRRDGSASGALILRCAL